MNNELLKLYLELENRKKYSSIDFLYPNTGQDDHSLTYSTWSRHLYPKHLEFFATGAKYKERLFLAGNRVGKTMAGAYEIVCHLTGNYPSWWEGKRFDSPNSWWAISETSEMSIKTLQRVLLGPVGDPGSGMIPKHLIDFDTMPKATKIGVGVSGVKVKHVSGGYSSVEFKAVQQGVESFVGVSCSIWVDELLPLPIYNECITRITLGGNIMMHTFTPILGYSTQLSAFFGDEGYRVGEISKFKYCTSATIWDVPHITEDERTRLYESWPAHVREARAKGLPQLSQGQVFPYSAEMISCEPFKIPDHYTRIYGLDVGWRAWAACWLAIDPDTGIAYCYSSYLAGEKTPLQHWESLKTRGEWIPCAADPASHGRQQSDGAIIFDQLRDFGMNIRNANNAREAGIYSIGELFNAGQLKIFTTEQTLIRELLNLERDDKGKIKDSSSKHQSDSFRYAVMSRNEAKNQTVKRTGAGFSSRRW